MDERVKVTVEKAIEGKDISFEEAMLLWDMDLLSLGHIADSIAQRLHKNKVFFAVNRHINPTNICINKCKFCAFSTTEDDPDSFDLEMEDIIKKAEEAYNEGAKELHIVGGLHPKKGLNFYTTLIKKIKVRFPDINIKGLTAVEIDFFAKTSGKSIEYVLKKLKDSGLDIISGGGAEIFSERVRKLICPDKIDSSRYLEIHKKAHLIGFKTNCTMLFGHLETKEERVSHLMALRDLQKETGGFNAFIPLVFHPDNTQIKIEKTNGVDILKTVAISRIILNNIPHIKAYWVTLNEGLAQIALKFGANDFEGTVIEEKITHAAGAESPQGLPKNRIIKLIKDAGKIPVERDGLYNELRIYN